MANRTGVKGNKGGAKSRKNAIWVDFNGFADLAEQLDMLGADLHEIFQDVMEQTAETVQEDTESALASGNLPAGGQYSRGNTANSIVQSPSVTWSGEVGEIPLGFEFSKPGAGGFLITGTPRMRPDYELERIYSGRKYENDIKRDIEDYLQAEIDSRIG